MAAESDEEDDDHSEQDSNDGNQKTMKMGMMTLKFHEDGYPLLPQNTNLSLGAQKE